MAIFLSRPLRPNKYPEIKFHIGSKASLSPSLSFLLLRGKFKHVYATWQCVYQIQKDVVVVMILYAEISLAASNPKDCDFNNSLVAPNTKDCVLYSGLLRKIWLSLPNDLGSIIRHRRVIMDALNMYFVGLSQSWLLHLIDTRLLFCIAYCYFLRKSDSNCYK